jgi:hypothetical protein
VYGEQQEDCSVEESANGSTITCNGKIVEISNGNNGLDGSNGIDGVDGVDGNDGEKGNSGNDGNDGVNGVNGTDGIDGNDGIISPYSVVNIIDPCGDHPSHSDQVILKLYNGDLMTSVKEGNKTFNVVLEPGSYQTLDKQKCNYSVNVNGDVSW